MYKPIAICVVSGGLDSTTMLYHVMDIGFEPIVITFKYGQKHDIEIYYAKRTCKELGLKHYVLNIPVLPGSALTESEMEVPKEDYSVETQKSTVVPNRNMVFLSIAAAYAIAEDTKDIFYAAHKSDAVYPDCTKKFVDKLNAALREANYEYLTVHAPFISKMKYDIVVIGDELGVPFVETWSCYDPVNVKKEDNTLEAIHCGVCGTCRERKVAFEVAEVTDPTRYAQ